MPELLPEGLTMSSSGTSSLATPEWESNDGAWARERGRESGS
jgi:hypothetical protein